MFADRPARPAARRPGAGPSRARRRAAAVALATALAATAAPAWALEADRDQPMEIAANSSDINLESGVHLLSGTVEIRQGSLLIQADTGEVHQPGQGAEVTRVVLEGEPARLEQALDNAAGQMRASARRIDYDRAGDTVVMTGGVRIEEPRGTLTGERVTYNIAQGRIQGQSSGEDGRVRFVIPPRPAQADPGDD
jgi:lipopolysaccharide export system protein LptA